MVKIYTDKSMITEEIIEDNNRYFNILVGITNIDDVGCQAIKAIDAVEEIYRESNSVKTPYGVTSVANLSTGAKTALNVLYLQKQGKPFAIDLRSCGANALREIFNAVDDKTEAKFYLPHRNIPPDVVREFLINDSKIAKDGLELALSM